MRIDYLDIEEVLLLHHSIIEDYGGSHGVKDIKRIQSVVEAPKQKTFGKEQYEGIHKKAAVYMRNIISDHPFVDGNKRTGVVVVGIFLSRNGQTLTANKKDLEDFAVRIATENTEVDTIAQWLEEHSKKSK